MRTAGGYRDRGLAKSIDWWLVACWVLLVIIGWANIYASIHSTEPESIFSWGCRSGKQFVWIMSSLGIAGLIMFIIPPSNGFLSALHCGYYIPCGKISQEILKNFKQKKPLQSSGFSL